MKLNVSVGAMALSVKCVIGHRRVFSGVTDGAPQALRHPPDACGLFYNLVSAGRKGNRSCFHPRLPIFIFTYFPPFGHTMPPPHHADEAGVRVRIPFTAHNL